jgi:hypothetical protein
MLAKDPTAYANLYQPVYNWFLQNMFGTTVTPPRQTTPTPRARRAAQPAAPAVQPRTRTRTAAGTQTRSRTAPGTLGTQDARILAAINATPGIAVEAVRRKFKAVLPNLVGTSIARLLKAGYISGVPSIGPWAITTPGIEVLNKQPASINQERRRRTAAKTPAAGETAAMAQTG